MKKLAQLVFLGTLGTFALADWDIAGQITAIDPVNHTITLNGNAVICPAMSQSASANVPKRRPQNRQTDPRRFPFRGRQESKIC